MKFIKFNKSTFSMGELPGESESFEDYEMPQKQVELGSFEIASTCVTRREWADFLKETKFAWGFEDEVEKYSPSLDHPAVFVSWFDAVAFCKWKSVSAGKIVRLPTEAEWEFVCRNVSIKSKEARVTFKNWCEQFGEINPKAGFSELPQEFEVYGIWEGVQEWCQDTFNEEAYLKLGRVNPIMRGEGKWKVFRGGSPLSIEYPRCSSRGYLSPEERSPVLGFRPVISEVNNEDFL